jgi:hypothetical protein
MTWMILWAAIDKPTLFESDEYETLLEAEHDLRIYHARYPWNTYYLVRVERTRKGTGRIPPPLDGVTITLAGDWDDANEQRGDKC